MSLLGRSGRRYMRRHPWLLALSVVGVALGVGVVLAIDLANQSSARAFELSTESVLGRTTHQIVGGPSGLDERLYYELRIEKRIEPIAPVVARWAIAKDRPGETLSVLGVDPFSEPPFRPHLRQIGDDTLDVTRLLTTPKTATLSATTAERVGVRAGDQLTLVASGREIVIDIVGVIDPQDPLDQRALESLIITDIATAQELFDAEGRIDRIDLIVDSDDEATLAQLEALLPAGARIELASSRSRTAEQMTRAFRFNLLALSLLALLVGSFLIYNTMTFSVVQRRQLIGTFRALGVTRAELFRQVLFEALFVGVIGTLAGIAFGIVLGRGLLGLVAQTINDLYFVVNVRSLALEPASLAKGIGLGLIGTLVAAVIPAYEATTTSPRTAMMRSQIETRARRGVGVVSAAGVALIAVGVGVLLVPSRSLIVAFVGLFGLLVGAAMLTPLATMALSRVIAPVVTRAFGVLGTMAARGVVRTLSRTAVAIAALAVAVSVTVGVGMMIHSFRTTVVRWLEASLQSDIYVTPPWRLANAQQGSLDPALIDAFSSSEGIAQARTVHAVQIESKDGTVQMVNLGLGRDGFEAFVLKVGEPDDVWRQLEQGAVFVSEPFAYRRRVSVGDSLDLLTDRGWRSFPIAGITYDYGSERGTAFMLRSQYDRYWDDRDVGGLALVVEEGRDTDDVIATLKSRVPPGIEVVIRSNTGLLAASMEIFDRTFAITSVLRMLAIVVAFIGVLSALMALQLERSREFAVLRANGMTPRQLFALIGFETGFMGLIAGALSLPIGTMLAAVMIYVINRRSFGWSMELIVSTSALWQALVLSLLAALLAGVYPAYKLSRTPPAVALRTE